MSSLPRMGPEKWDQVFSECPEPFGTKSSEVGNLASRFLEPGARVLGIGLGYPRDILPHKSMGFLLSSAEESPVARTILEQVLAENEISLEHSWGNFLEADLPAEYFDGLMSQRVLHAFLKKEHVWRFVSKSAETVRKGGYIIVGARDFRELEFKASQYEELEFGVYVGLDENGQRMNHRSSFWNEKRYTNAFSGEFEILEVREHSEMLDYKHPDEVCFYTTMVGRKK